MLRLATITLLAALSCACGYSPATHNASYSQNPSPSPAANAPAVASISPATAQAGSIDISITIIGSNFNNQGVSLAGWSRNPTDQNCCNTWLLTTFVDSTQLTAVIPAQLLQSAGSAQVFVETGDPQGITDGVSYPRSNSVSFTVTAPSASGPSGATFTPTGAMHGARTGHTATLLNDGKVLIVGGGVDTAELFDPPSGTFSLTGAPVAARIGATATLLSNGTVLIAGGLGLTPGQNGTLPFIGSAEIFDPATGTFHSVGSLVQTRFNHTATRLPDGRVLIAGGYKGLCITATAELFDPASETFSPAGFMLSQRAGHTATLLNNGQVLLAGGANGCSPDAADDPPWDPLFAELFNPASMVFTGSGNMSTTRIGHSAVLLPNGDVLVLGGIPSIQNLHSQPPRPAYAEIYYPTAKTFSAVPGLSVAHERYTATLLNDGLVLVAGGVDATGTATSQTELIDPSAGIVRPTNGLGTARVGHTATLLNDGRVLVTGGTAQSGAALDSAELYN